VVDLGEIGSAAEKDWQRATPYSPAIKIQGVKFQNETPLIAFVNDLEEPEKPPDFGDHERTLQKTKRELSSILMTHQHILLIIFLFWVTHCLLKTFDPRRFPTGNENPSARRKRKSFS